MISYKRNYDPMQLNNLLDQEMVQHIHGRRHFCIPLEKGGYFLNFYYCNINSPARHDAQVCFYCDNQQLVMISENNRCRSILEQIPQSDSPFLQLATFFSVLITDDIDVLEELEDRITTLEDKLLVSSGVEKSVAGKIVTMRRRLLRIKRYYEQLQQVMDQLSEDQGEELSENLERRYLLLSRRMDQLLSMVQNLRESLTQVREAYQAQIDIEQNKLMKIFTVITTICMPLTIIVGWYGMNFDTMPELRWDYGYAYVIFLSIAVICGFSMIFKENKWFK